VRSSLITAAVAGICVLGATSPAVRAASRGTHVPSTQPLALLLSNHLAHLHPRGGSRRVAAIAEFRPITGERTALPVIGAARDSHGGRWLRVMLPGRPNGSTGWIARQGTSEVANPWRLIVQLGARRVLVYRGGKLVRRFGAVIGKPSTPTPTGSFFVEETVKLGALEPGGPFALALSGRSDALREFDGGPGQIALHGRDGLGGTLGTAVSHGCIRLATASIDWLAERIGPGVPVKINRS
jgi:lipoprotein-anchoring transpeptidase ErfK/SrfK